MSERTGAAVTGVSIEEQASLPESSVAQAVFLRRVLPAGQGSARRSAIVRERLPRALKAPRVKEQVDGASNPGEQVQPGEPMSGTNAVPFGSSSERMTPEASWSPEFVTVR